MGLLVWGPLFNSRSQQICGLWEHHAWATKGPKEKKKWGKKEFPLHLFNMSLSLSSISFYFFALSILSAPNQQNQSKCNQNKSNTTTLTVEVKNMINVLHIFHIFFSKTTKNPKTLTQNLGDFFYWTQIQFQFQPSTKKSSQIGLTWNQTLTLKPHQN